MSPLELQRALAQMPSRSAQTLIFRCLEGRTPAECAALYGVALPQWEVLFFDAMRALRGDTQPLTDSARATLAHRLQSFEPAGDPLAALAKSLTDRRAEVQALLLETEKAAANSPARVREGWLRRLAILAIIAVSYFVWTREKNRPPVPTPSHFPLPNRGVG